MTTFQQLLHKPEYVWDLEEIDREQTDPEGYSNSFFDHIDTVNDLISYQMLAEHHQVAFEINQYIQANTNQWILPQHKPFI